MSQTTSSLESAHRQAVWRKRRIIYNDDGGAVKHMSTPEVATVVAKRLGRLPGTQVDSYFYCSHDDFGKAFYKSDIEGVELNGAAGLMHAIQMGVDPSREHVDFCRNNGLEVFWSFRMNDIHDSYDRRLGKFKREHQEWLLGQAGVEYPKQSIQAGTWSAMDYAVPQVHDHVLGCIREVCNRYDLDGAEFDYGRNASLFRPTFQEQHVGEEHLDMLTELQRRLRSWTQALARQRNRPFVLAAVVPETVKLCRYVGIDTTCPSTCG